ncbi:hypothetical protein [Streptomyces sp. NPDC003710]
MMDALVQIVRARLADEVADARLIGNVLVTRGASALEGSADAAEQQTITEGASCPGSC